MSTSLAPIQIAAGTEKRPRHDCCESCLFIGSCRPQLEHRSACRTHLDQNHRLPRRYPGDGRRSGVLRPAFSTAEGELLLDEKNRISKRLFACRRRAGISGEAGRAVWLGRNCNQTLVSEPAARPVAELPWPCNGAVGSLRRSRIATAARFAYPTLSRILPLARCCWLASCAARA
jgi:hypothetical protein